MASVGKTLGQENPGPVLTDLYRVPNGGQATVSVTVCNTGVFAEQYRVSVAPQGAGDAQKQYLAYDKVIAPNDAETIGGISVRADDVIRVYASTVAVSFNANGTETV